MLILDPLKRIDMENWTTQVTGLIFVDRVEVSGEIEMEEIEVEAIKHLVLL